MRIAFSLLFFAFFTSVIPSCKTTSSRSEISSAQSGTPERSDAIYGSVRGMLDKKYPKELGKTWSYGTMNLAPDWIIQSPADIWGKTAVELPSKLDCDLSDSRCDKKFLRLSCSTDNDCPVVGTHCLALEAAVAKWGAAAPNRCLAPADDLLNRYYRVMVAAQSELDIASLSMPNGRFLTATINALSVLTQKTQIPKIRLFFSGEDAGKLNIINPPDKVLAAWTSQIKDTLRENGLDESGLNRLEMDLAWLSNKEITNINQLFDKFGSFISWNHAKIIAADGKRALVGGHNMWDKDYLSPTPIFDLSMEYSGKAAEGAVEFMVTLSSSAVEI